MDMLLLFCMGKDIQRGGNHHETFAGVHQNLAEDRSFRAMIDDIPVNSEMDLMARIFIAAVTIHEITVIFIRFTIPFILTRKENSVGVMSKDRNNPVMRDHPIYRTL
ncbi:hypothetical protein TNCV_137641 [Trichonephila clavipes]|nr:hypothetical protein TNCV_137641 [Trichonephila clavipes]